MVYQSMDIIFVTHFKSYFTRHDLAAWLTSRKTQPQWSPFYLHSKLCKNDTSVAYLKKRGCHKTEHSISSVY